MKSLRGNVILNGINTLSSMLFPVITFPYAARVLLPEGIGAINFLNSIIGYIILLTSLGIPLYAVKEVARFSEEKRERDKVTIEILLFSSLLCLLGYVIVWILAHFVPTISSQSSLFYVLSLSILFTSIGANWFYQGIENFKFITVRSLIVKTISAALLFIFVHNPGDLLIYGFIIVGSTVGGNLINFIHLRKHVTFSGIEIKELNILRHLRPATQVFILNLIVSLYIQLNSVMLGFMAGDDAVGYFTAGTKISHICVMVISSLGTVLLPRCSHLFHQGDMDGFSRVVGKSLSLTQLLSYPMVVGLIVLAVPLTMIFCGDEYYAAIPVAILNAPVVYIISMTNLMGMQILYPMDKIKIVIISVSGGAVVNLVLNILLIPGLEATGAAIATLAAETMVLILQAVLGKKYYPFRQNELLNFKYLSSALMMGIAVWFSTFIIYDNWLKLCIGVPMGFILYFLILYLQKDDFFRDTAGVLFRKIRKVI